MLPINNDIIYLNQYLKLEFLFNMRELRCLTRVTRKLAILFCVDFKVYLGEQDQIIPHFLRSTGKRM